MKSERKRTEHDDLVGTVQVGHRHSLTHSVELRFATPLEGIYPAAGTLIKPRTGVSIASESSGNDSNDSSPERERYTSTDGSRANNTADREQHDASTERTSVRRGKCAIAEGVKVTRATATADLDAIQRRRWCGSPRPFRTLPTIPFLRL